MFFPETPPIPIPPHPELAWNASVDDLLVEIIKKRNTLSPVVIQKLLAILKKETTPENIEFKPGTPPVSSSYRRRNSHL